MSTYYAVILIIGSKTLYSKVTQLVASVKAGDKEKISIDVFFLLITLVVIGGLVALKEYRF